MLINIHWMVARSFTFGNGEKEDNPSRSEIILFLLSPHGSGVSEWESQNMRDRRDLERSSSPMSLLKQEHLDQVTQEHVREGHEYLQRRDPTTSLGTLFRSPSLWSFFIFMWNILCSNLYSLPFVILLSQHLGTGELLFLKANSKVWFLWTWKDTTRKPEVQIFT